MITQAELREVIATQDATKVAAKAPAVAEYLRLVDQEKTLTAEIRKRVKAGEAIETGRVKVQQKITVAVAWEKFWTRLRELPAIAKAIAGSAEARSLLAGIITKNPESPYVSERLEVTIVRP